MTRLKEALKSSSLGQLGVAVARAVHAAQVARLWRRLGPLDASSEAPSARVLVATSLGGFQASIALDPALAVGLAQRGAQVDVLLCDASLPACQLCDAYWFSDISRFSKSGPSATFCGGCFSPAAWVFRAAGVAIRTFSERLDQVLQDELAAVAQQVPVKGLRTFHYSGMPVGEHAYAGAIRFFAKGRIEGEAHWEAVVRRYLHAAMLTAEAVSRLLDVERYDVVVLHHGIYVPQGIIRALAKNRGIRVVTWHVGYRSKCFIFSHEDTYHRTMIDEPTDVWADLELAGQDRRLVLDYLQSRWSGAGDWIHFNRNPQEDIDEISRRFGISRERPWVTLFTNVMWDAQLHYPQNAFPDQAAWILATVRWFASRADLELIIRVHPAEKTGNLPSRDSVREMLLRDLGGLPTNVHLVDAGDRVSSYVIAAASDAVLVYSTKLSVELAAQGKRVIVAGEAWTRGKGISEDADSPEHYFRLLAQLPFSANLPPATRERALRYAAHFFFRRMIPLPFVKALPMGQFCVTADALTELEEGVHPGWDVAMRGILQGTPFIFPGVR